MKTKMNLAFILIAFWLGLAAAASRSSLSSDIGALLDMKQDYYHDPTSSFLSSQSSFALDIATQFDKTQSHYENTASYPSSSPYSIVSSAYISRIHYKRITARFTHLFKQVVANIVKLPVEDIQFSISWHNASRESANATTPVLTPTKTLPLVVNTEKPVAAKPKQRPTPTAIKYHEIPCQQISYENVYEKTEEELVDFDWTFLASIDPWRNYEALVRIANDALPFDWEMLSYTFEFMPHCEGGFYMWDIIKDKDRVVDAFWILHDGFVGYVVYVALLAPIICQLFGLAQKYVWTACADIAYRILNSDLMWPIANDLMLFRWYLSIALGHCLLLLWALAMKVFRIIKYVFFAIFNLIGYGMLSVSIIASKILAILRAGCIPPLRFVHRMGCLIMSRLYQDFMEPEALLAIVPWTMIIRPAPKTVAVVLLYVSVLAWWLHQLFSNAAPTVTEDDLAETSRAAFWAALVLDEDQISLGSWNDKASTATEELPEASTVGDMTGRRADDEDPEEGVTAACVSPTGSEDAPDDPKVEVANAVDGSGEEAEAGPVFVEPRKYVGGRGPLDQILMGFRAFWSQVEGPEPPKRKSRG